MKIGVVGMGAVGMLLTYFLNKAGVVPLAVARTKCERYLFCWGECVELKVELADSARGVDYTFLAVKAYDTAEALERAGGIIVVVQNGIGGVEEARARGLYAQPAVLTYGVYREGCVAEFRGSGVLYLPAELAGLGDLLRRGDMRVVLVEDIEPIRWMKLAVNAAINPVTALLNAPNGVVAENQWARELAMGLASEVGAVAKSVGVELPGDPGEEALRVAENTRQNVSSMLQDIRRGRRTEIDYINGAVVAIGERRGVPTPLNKAVYFLVKALESRRLSTQLL